MSDTKIARGIWPALCTAFDDSGAQLDEARNRALLRHLIDVGSHGFFVTGGTGEGGALTVPERKQMAQISSSEVAGAVPKLFLQMRQFFDSSDVNAAMQCQVRANRVISALMKVGVLAGVKAMLGWRGLPVGPPRIAKPLTGDGEKELQQALDSLGFEVA